MSEQLKKLYEEEIILREKIRIEESKVRAGLIKIREEENKPVQSVSCHTGFGCH